MKALFSLILLIVAVLPMTAGEAKKQIIRIVTDKTDLVLEVAPNKRLYQTYLGPKLLHEEDLAGLSWSKKQGSDICVSERGWEAYSTSGNEDFFEPALGITHADGNMTTYLYYVDSTQEEVPGGIHTRINLRDDKYSVSVTLNYVAYAKENIIKTWSEISNLGNKPVTMSQYASAMLYFNKDSYWLTEFSTDWASEAQPGCQELKYGKKILDTKLGSRPSMHTTTFFEVGMDGEAKENFGEVLMGTLGWTGNYRFIFEVDNVGYLRVIAGINPYASAYDLQPGKTFTTPEFIFTLSENGVGAGSRDFHDWARKYDLKDGMGDRLTLLNNWENTAFNFNQKILADLMKEAKNLGVDMFLLDDGWFGNKHPRKDDHAVLGDWEVNHSKLPGGIAALTEAAKKAGVKFGIWIEPEMVNPNSELFERHPDWAIRQPNREPYYFRNQLVLDLSNPDVQDHVFSVVDKILTENPDVAYFKWDCNSPITNIYSPYAKEKQNRLYVDHIRGLYNVLHRIKAKYPDVPMMLCSGGSARCDYEALKYFTEFWCSDNTDPVSRIFIQWGFSQFFPTKAIAAHVTDMNKTTSIKFRTDVASMCKLGFDIDLKGLSDQELAYCQEAIKNWKRLQPAIMDGDQYRLVAPYNSNHAAVEYLDKSKTMGVLFAYNLPQRAKEKISPVKLQGLDPDRKYLVKEINLMPGTESTFARNGEILTGDYLMKIGIDVFAHQRNQSMVIELKAI